MIIERINYILIDRLGNKAVDFKYFLASIVVNSGFYGRHFHVEKFSYINYRAKRADILNLLKKHLSAALTEEEQNRKNQ